MHHVEYCQPDLDVLFWKRQRISVEPENRLILAEWDENVQPDVGIRTGPQILIAEQKFKIKHIQKQLRGLLTKAHLFSSSTSPATTTTTTTRIATPATLPSFSLPRPTTTTTTTTKSAFCPQQLHVLYCAKRV